MRRRSRETELITARNGYADMNAAEEARLVYLLDALRLGKSDRDAVVQCFLHLMENDGLVAQRYDNLRQLCLLRAPVSVGQGVVGQIVPCSWHATLELCSSTRSQWMGTGAA